MNAFECPLHKNAIENPTAPFIKGSQSFTYSEFDAYIEQISQELIPFKPGDVIVAIATEPTFIIGLLIASMRKKLILFLLSPRLPEEEIKKRIIETKAVHTFERLIIYTPSYKSPSEKKIFYDLDLPLTYLLTSGSTSSPKICVHSAQNHFYSALGSNEALPYDSDDSWLLSLPLFHVGGLSLIFRTLLAKASLTIPKGDLVNSLREYPITHLSCVNTQFMRLLEAPSLLKPLKVILLGGGPISSPLLKKASTYSLPIYTTYGLTEMSSQVATSSAFAPLSLLQHREFSLDTNAQILVRGKTLFLGYLESGEIVPCRNKDGWFETRDLGKMCNGHLQVIGRMDNQFISGGENIQPEEIETLLLKYPTITEAIVVPKEDPKFGQVPLAFIKSTGEIAQKKLIEFLENFLPRYKIPKSYLPLEYAGLKPSRKKLTHISLI